MNSTLRLRQTVAAVAMGLVALATARGAEALSLGVAPSASIVAPGDPLSVDVVISGLGDGAAPSLGVFDLDNLGQVVGRATTADGVLHSFLWQDGIMTELVRTAIWP